MNAKQITALLYLHVKIPPQAWDAIIPHGPKFSTAAREYLAAQALKGLAAQVANKKVKAKLADIQKRLVEFAGKNLAADYDDDNWCGTVPRPHFPFPLPDPNPWPWLSSLVTLNPQPEPPAPALLKEIGGYLLLLSEVTSQEAVAGELKELGTSLAR